MGKDQGQGSSPPLLLQTNQSTPHAPNDIGSNQWNPNGAKVQSLGDAGCNKPLLASNWFHQDGQDGPLSAYWAYLAYGVWLGATRTPHFLGLYKRWISWKTNHFKSCNIHVSIVRYQGPGHQPLQGLRVDSLSARTISLYLIIHYQPASQTLPVEVEGTCQLCSQLESHWWHVRETLRPTQISPVALVDITSVSNARPSTNTCRHLLSFLHTFWFIKQRDVLSPGWLLGCPRICFFSPKIGWSSACV